MNRPPFFIVGVPRSGTTLLTVLLNNHPELFLDREAIAIRTLDFYQRVEQAVKKHPQIGARPALLAFTPTAVEVQVRWKDEAAKDERLHRFLHWPLLDEKPEITLSEFITASFAHRAASSGKTYFGDKSPDAVERLSELTGHFPSAKIIVVVRDARPNVLSLVRRQYMPLRVAAQRWKDWNAAADAALAWHGPDRIHRLRYEDLLLRPEETIAGVCTFLGVPFRPEMLDLNRAAATQGDNAYVKQSINTEAITRWRKKITPQELKSINSICGGWLNRFGYEAHGAPFGDENLGFFTDYRLRVANAFRLVFVPTRKLMRDQTLVDVRLPLSHRLFVFAATVAGGLFRKDLLDAVLPQGRR